MLKNEKKQRNVTKTTNCNARPKEKEQESKEAMHLVATLRGGHCDEGLDQQRANP